jgi:hypothetical protein
MSVWLLCESWGFARGYKQGGGVGLVQPRCPKGAHPLGHHFFACAPKTCKETNDQKGANDASQNSIPFDLNPIVPLLQPLNLHLT